MKDSTSIRYESITWVIRVIVGMTFLLSGFVKAIDPWGLLYKTDEYLAVMSIDVWPNLKLVGVFCLSALEFVVGVFLLFGCFRRSVVYVAGILMCGMLPLTLWLAIDDPVSDCGCFGDALQISNWMSFWKNVLLSAGIAWLWKYNSKCSWLVTPALQWLTFLVSGIFILTIELFGYLSQPLIDFRAYKAGLEIVEPETSEREDSGFVFIYEKDGKRKEFSSNDELPDEDDGWVFVDRKEKSNDSSVSNSEEHVRNLRVWTKDGQEDITEEALQTSGKELLIMMPNLKEVSPATTWKLNSLFEWSERYGVEMIAIVAGSSREISDWEDISMASYPIHTADDTQIKEVVRGNPGVVYLENGIIEWKSTLTALNINDFMSPEISSDAHSFVIDSSSVLKNCISLYIILMMVLVLLSFLPKMRKFYLTSTSADVDDPNKESETQAE